MKSKHLLVRELVKESHLTSSRSSLNATQHYLHRKKRQVLYQGLSTDIDGLIATVVIVDGSLRILCALEDINTSIFSPFSVLSSELDS